MVMKQQCMCALHSTRFIPCLVLIPELNLRKQKHTLKLPYGLKFLKCMKRKFHLLTRILLKLVQNVGKLVR